MDILFLFTIYINNNEKEKPFIHPNHSPFILIL